MSLPTVEIVMGTETPIGEGRSGALRCIVRYPDTSTRAAIVKTLPAKNVAAEAFCALLLRGWGLSVPEPAIVSGPPMAFACTEVFYPNLKQRIGWSQSLPWQVQKVFEAYGAKLVAGFTQTPLALAADEAIENRDRHFGNILWDGNEVSWIDHDQSLKVGTLPMRDENKLVTIAVMSGDHSKIEKAAIALSLTLGANAVDEALLHCNAMPAAAEFGPQVAARLSNLAASVIARFPRPPDLFTNGDVSAS